MDSVEYKNGKPYFFRRVVPTHTTSNFVLEHYSRSVDTVITGSSATSAEFILGMLPLDVIDDITYSDRYNPRKLKPAHRDLLMEQIGTYGLINPLVAVMGNEKASPHSVYLVDGRHRYNALLELDEPLKKAILNKAKEVEKDRSSISSGHIEEKPRPFATNIIHNYEPKKEKIEGNKEGTIMVPVKLYVRAEEVETIGMAVFLNKGQKKLSGGEQIEKVAKAFELSLEEQRKGTRQHLSEILAAQKVSKGSAASVISSWLVARIMNDSENEWAEVIGRWQGEKIRDKLKPLTAANFQVFLENLVDVTPKEEYKNRQRDFEVENFVRLGRIFSEVFEWPDRIPDQKNRYNATSVLSRSFVIRALAIELNERGLEKIGNNAESHKLMSNRIDEELWVFLTGLIKKVFDEFEDQSHLRIKFEEIKRDLNDMDYGGKERQKMLQDMDSLRGQLWSLDTVTAVLKTRIGEILK